MPPALSKIVGLTNNSPVYVWLTFWFVAMTAAIRICACPLEGLVVVKPPFVKQDWLKHQTQKD